MLTFRDIFICKSILKHLERRKKDIVCFTISLALSEISGNLITVLLFIIEKTFCRANEMLDYYASYALR